MKCPICVGVNLQMSERQGVEIDYCPQCRGVWLDRGELDKIIERAGDSKSPSTSEARAGSHQATFTSTPPSSPPIQHQHHQQQHYPSQQTPQHYSAPQHQQQYPQHGGHYKKKKESFLSDLFDFD